MELKVIMLKERAEHHIKKLYVYIYIYILYIQTYGNDYPQPIP